MGFIYIDSEEGTAYPVWSIKALAWTVRATGVWPKGSGGAIYYDHRVNRPFALSATECWRLQGLPLDLKEELTRHWMNEGRDAVYIDTATRRLAGNAISWYA